jgi:hypothetical protein
VSVNTFDVAVGGRRGFHTKALECMNTGLQLGKTMLSRKAHCVRRCGHQQPYVASNYAGNHRMKMLLAVIESPVDSTSVPVDNLPSISLRTSGAITPPLEMECNSPAVLQEPDGKRATPSQKSRSQIRSALQRPPRLPNALVRAPTQPTFCFQGLKMPMSLLKVTPAAGDSKPELHSVNYNDLPKTITVKKPWQPSAPKSTPKAALRQRLTTILV